MTNVRSVEPMIRRRRLLGGLAAMSLPAGLVSGCSSLDQPTPEPTTPDPDAALRNRVAEAERSLLARYAAVTATHPDLAAQLGAFTDRHNEHLSALLPASASPSASPSPAVQADDGVDTDVTPGVSVSPAAPDDPEAALAELREAERRASEAQIAFCPAASDPNLARLLAVIGGCEAAHAVLLGAGLRGAGS